MYKGHSNSTAFIKARVAQSVKNQARNLKVVGSSPNADKNFSFFVLFFAPDRSTGHIQMKSSMTFIRGNRCIERMII